MARPPPAPADEEPPAPPDPADLAVLEPPRTRRRWALGVAAVGLALLGGWWFFGGSDAPDYQTESIRVGTLTQRITAVGQLEPLQSVEIGSDLTGVIEAVLVDENDHVASGQVLARLDPTTFGNAVAQRRASLASARANLKKSRIELQQAAEELDRTTGLHARGADTLVAVEQAQLVVSASQATVEAAMASRDQAAAVLERAAQDLEDTVIRAPVDGVVIRRMVDPGQTVVSAMTATPLFEVASDLHHLKVEVAVDEADVGRVASGQDATFTVTTFPDRTFRARVASVDLAADATSSVVVYGTELHVVNPELALRPGMTATAEITVGEIDDAMLVPTIALRFRPPRIDAPDGDSVWTLVDGQLTPVPVRVGGSDGATTAIYGDDLVDGMRVVVGGGR